MSDFEVFTTLEEWRSGIENDSVRGLYVERSVLMLDRRANDKSVRYQAFGTRSVDLNLIGADRMVVPGDVTFSYIAEAIGLRKLTTEMRLRYTSGNMGIH